jgi:YesN/AraC family two-component response regulator
MTNLLLEIYQFLTEITAPGRQDEFETIFSSNEQIKLARTEYDVLSVVEAYISCVIKYLKCIRFKKYEVFTARAISYIRDNYEKNIGTQDVAEHLGISADYFSSIFRQSTGKTFVRYFSEFKIKKAKDLLRFPDLKIAEISAMSGFNDVKYFTKVFRAFVKMTPSEYRQKCLEEG